MTKEETLISQCLKGDRKAYKNLYDTYKTHWYMICLRYLKNEMNAQDILQNALVKIFSKLNLFDHNKSQFKTWSSKIVVNECIMYFRKKQLQLQSLEIAENTVANNDPCLDPISNMSTQEIMKVVRDLPEGYRVVFNMIAVEGYTHKEVGKELDISEGTSKSQYFKARKILKSRLENFFNYTQAI